MSDRILYETLTNKELADRVRDSGAICVLERRDSSTCTYTKFHWQFYNVMGESDGAELGEWRTAQINWLLDHDSNPIKPTEVQILKAIGFEFTSSKAEFKPHIVPAFACEETVAEEVIKAIRTFNEYERQAEVDTAMEDLETLAYRSDKIKQCQVWYSVDKQALRFKYQENDQHVSDCGDIAVECMSKESGEAARVIIQYLKLAGLWVPNNGEK